MFRHPGFAQAVENGLELGQIRRVVAHSRPIGAGAGDGEGRVEREPSLDCGMRLVQSAKLRERGSQQKMLNGKFRLASIARRNHATAWSQVPSWFFACPRNPSRHSHRIARTEAQGLTDVSLCFFGATNESLAKSDKGMGAGKISIQRQRMFTFGDALCRALGEYLDKSQATDGRAHGPGPRTRLWSTLLRPPQRPPWDRSQRNLRPQARPRPPIQ